MTDDYTYVYKESRGHLNVAASMEMDGVRARTAPTATQIRDRVLAETAKTNGHHEESTRRVLPSEAR